MEHIASWGWWRPRVVDGLWAAFEAGVALSCSLLWLLVLVIRYGLDTSGVGLLEAVQATLTTHFEPADALQYLTAILSSTTAYMLFRLASMRNNIRRAVFLLCAPAFLWFLATPLLMLPEPSNEQFAGDLAILVVAAGLFVWWFSLFNQRRVLERTPTGPSDAGAKGIMRKLDRNQ